MKNPELFLSSFIEHSGDWHSFIALAKQTIKTRFHFSYENIQQYNVTELIPVDTGAILFWQELQGTFDDEQIVQKLQNGSLLGDCNWPQMTWHKYSDDTYLWKPGNDRDVRCCYIASFFYLASLARVAWLHKDKNLVRLFAKVIDDFYEKNSPTGNLDEDWDSIFWGDMRAAWRIQMLWLTFFILCDSEDVSNSTWLKVFHIIFADADRIYQYRCRHGYKAWNHDSHYMVALAYCAVLTPDMKFSDKWFNFAAAEIKQHGIIELYDDGGSLEACPCYDLFIYMHYRDTLLLARRNDRQLPAGFYDLTRKQLKFLLDIRQPDGSTLPINDSAEVNFAFDLQLAQSEFDLAVDNKTSVYYPDSQIAIMRSRDQKTYLAIDASKYAMGHWHGGKPGLILWLNQQPLLIEAGMNHYSVDDFFSYRDLAGNAHNTLRVDQRGDSIMDLNSKWDFKSTAHCSILDWQSNDKFDYLRITNDGFMTLEDPVSFTRTILFIKDNYFIITDDLTGQAEHHFEWLAHFPPNKLRLTPDSCAVNSSFSQENILIQPMNRDEFDDCQEYRCKANVQGTITDLPYIAYHKTGKAFNSHLLLLPYTNSKPKLEIKTIKDNQDMFMCKIITDNYTDYFVERRCLKGAVTIENILFESELILIRKSVDAEQTEILLSL